MAQTPTLSLLMSPTIGYRDTLTEQEWRRLDGCMESALTTDGPHITSQNHPTHHGGEFVAFGFNHVGNSYGHTMGNQIFTPDLKRYANKHKLFHNFLVDSFRRVAAKRENTGELQTFQELVHIPFDIIDKPITMPINPVYLHVVGLTVKSEYADDVPYLVDTHGSQFLEAARESELLPSVAYANYNFTDIGERFGFRRFSLDAEK